MGSWFDLQKDVFTGESTTIKEDFRLELLQLGIVTVILPQIRRSSLKDGINTLRLLNDYNITSEDSHMLSLHTAEP